jgi:CheY-like chemotaxis protein
MTMSNRVLCVDDEPNVLHAFLRQFRKQFEVFTSHRPEQALRTLVEEGPFAVVVSDLRMPGMNGTEFLTRARAASPDTVRIMLTGQADLQDAVTAVNQGHLFQFLTKPCPAEMLGRAIEAGIEQHRLVLAERELLEKTLMSCIGVMAEILSFVNPIAFSRGQRIRRYVRHMADHLKLDARWQYEFAAMLSQIGCVTIAPEDLLRLQSLNESDGTLMLSQAKVGHDLLKKIPRLESVAEMVQRQTIPSRECTGQSAGVIGGQLLKIALDFDNRIVNGGIQTEVLKYMRSRSDYNPAYVDALARIQVDVGQSETRLLRLDQLEPGMIVNSDVSTIKGLLLLAKGHEITESTLACLKRVAEAGGVREPISVVLKGAAAPSSA